MARSFNGSTDQIDCGTNVLLCPTTGGVTYAGWVILNTPTAYDAPFGSYAPGSGFGFFTKSDGKIAIYCGGATVYDGTGTNTLSSGPLYHLAATFDNTSHVGFGYVNGAQDGTGTGTNPLSTQQFFIGFCPTGGAPFHGTVAEVAVWSAVLTPAEIAVLAAAYSPAFVRPGALEAYWPLIGRASPEIDKVGGFAGTVTGTTTVAHPRIIMPRKFKAGKFTTATGAATFPWAWARGSNLPVLGTGNY